MNEAMLKGMRMAAEGSSVAVVPVADGWEVRVRADQRSGWVTKGSFATWAGAEMMARLLAEGLVS